MRTNRRSSTSVSLLERRSARPRERSPVAKSYVRAHKGSRRISVFRRKSGIKMRDDPVAPHRADAVRQRIALCRQAEDICVEVVVGVLVVEGADLHRSSRERPRSAEGGPHVGTGAHSRVACPRSRAEPFQVCDPFGPRTHLTLRGSNSQQAFCSASHRIQTPWLPRTGVNADTPRTQTLR
jgi:hypothetical protein